MKHYNSDDLREWADRLQADGQKPAADFARAFAHSWDESLSAGPPMPATCTPDALLALIPSDLPVGRTHWAECSGRGHEWCAVARFAARWKAELSRQEEDKEPPWFTRRMDRIESILFKRITRPGK